MLRLDSYISDKAEEDWGLALPYKNSQMQVEVGKQPLRYIPVLSSRVLYRYRVGRKLLIGATRGAL